MTRQCGGDVNCSWCSASPEASLTSCQGGLRGGELADCATHEDPGGTLSRAVRPGGEGSEGPTDLRTRARLAPLRCGPAMIGTPRAQLRMLMPLRLDASGRSDLSAAAGAGWSATTSAWGNTHAMCSTSLILKKCSRNETKNRSRVNSTSEESSNDPSVGEYRRVSTLTRIAISRSQMGRRYTSSLRTRPRPSTTRAFSRESTPVPEARPARLRTGPARPLRREAEVVGQ